MPNFSGKWGLTEQLQAVAAGTWTGLPTSELYAWGSNNSAQLGDLTTSDRSSPVLVGFGINWHQASMSSSALSAAAVSSDHALWTWGQNNSGQLGDGTLVAKSSPVQVGANLDWDFVSVGGSFMASIKTNGTLWAWGYGFSGQLGQSSQTSFSSPVQIGALTSWSKIVAQGASCLAIRTDGTLWAWGNNSVGRLGIGSTLDKSSPTQVGALTNWEKVALGDGGAAIKTDNTLWMWGFNTNGVLGQNNRINRSAPVQVGGAEWAEVSVGASAVAVKTDGTLWAWGNRDFGQIGDNAVVSRSSPVQIGALTNWLKPPLGASNNSNACLKTDGTLWTWGKNDLGQLGQNDISNRSSPVQVGALTNWSSVSVGADSFLSLAEGTTN